jgi:magnesium chelatase subunit D
VNSRYPFTAIVGQRPMKLALLLNAINPRIGGVLIRGQKGTAKSTAVRGLAALLPDIEVIDGCRFRCGPDRPTCAECAARSSAASHSEPVALVELPIGATEDRVIGTLDIEHALSAGQRKFEPGLLARANRGLLYVDEVNLLPDHLVDTLLDAAASGVNTVERDGVSFSHPASFVLVGTMNPEEGELRPQLLDRFGLAVDIEGMPETSERAEVVRRRIAFERDQSEFVRTWTIAEQHEFARVRAAQRLLPSVELGDRLLELIARICADFEVDGLRADIVMYRTAATLAAYAGRTAVTTEDIRSAAELALPHRRRRQPFDQVGLDQHKLDDIMRDFSPTDEPPDGPPPPSDRHDETPPAPPDGHGHGAARSPEPPPTVFEVGPAPELRLAPPTNTDLQARTTASAARGRTRMVLGTRGRHVRSTPLAGGGIDVLATLATSSLRQPPRAVKGGDLRYKVRALPVGRLTIFLVDASGSMAARRRMALAKGAVAQLLARAYQTRDRVALIAFRGTQAVVVLPPTGSINLASDRLRELPTGGRTPLALAIRRAEALLSQHRAAQGASGVQRMVIISDGRANVPLPEGADAFADALDAARRLRDKRVQCVVVDTEDGPVRVGRAARLAAALDADYIPLGPGLEF